jgi:flagellar hook-length control protein FliK
MQIAIASPLARSGPPPSTSDAAAAEGNGSNFASLLQQQAPAPRESSTPPGDEADNGTADERRTTRQRAAAKPTTRPAERPAAREPDAAADAERTDKPDARQDLNGTDPGLRDWLAALHLPAQPPDAAAGAAAAAGASETALPAGVPMTGEALAQTPFRADAGGSAAATDTPRLGARDKAAGARALAIEGQAAAVTEATDTSRPAEAAESSARIAFELPAASRHPAATATEAVAPIASNAATSPAAPAAAPATVALATPLDDPQFPRAFGVQVSMLARDGVQQAELHLNPAEMGPVSVQIVMEGTQARIDFGADAAGTRQLIEHSLPDLAAALREAGLTLTGGGVSQHSARSDDARDQAATPREGDAHAQPGATSDAAPVRRNVRVGGVDLYA